MSGRLFVVATPIGNLEDLSPRAVRVLREVRLIACEDTRRTARLLEAHSLRTPLTSYFEHNERFKGTRILKALAEGQDVALVSDAGTPAISDPGFRLVRDARKAGIAVLPVPGPSAAIAALSVSGLPSDRFLFVGFLPRKPAARQKALEDLLAVEATLVLYESPVRIVKALDEMQKILGDREAFLCREATKLHEEYLSGRLSDIMSALKTRLEVKGEIVLVIAAGQPGLNAGPESAEEMYARLVDSGLTRREAVKQTARTLRLPARDVYRRVLDEEGQA